jgi:hypothetical protein
MKKIILIFLNLLFFNSVILSQISTLNSDSIFSKKLLYEVKQLDQFIARFNLSENIYGDKYPQEIIDSSQMHISSRVNVRKKVLKSLFNYENNKNDTVLIKSFIKDVSENSKEISFDNGNWFAIVNTTVKFDGIEKNAQIILQIEKNSKQEFKWVIRGVQANFLDNNTKITADFINPMNHETYFIDLKKIFENKNSIKQYAYKDFNPDELSIFLYLISQNKIQLKHIYSISYHFLQIDNYIFTIDFFNRSSFNSGWLISNLMEANADQKKQYLKNVLKVSEYGHVK